MYLLIVLLHLKLRYIYHSVFFLNNYFYQKKLKDLPRQFNVINADVIMDHSNMQTIGTDVTLPVTVYLTIQQKGRDGIQSIPIPSRWTWKTVEGRMTPVQVQDQ